MRSCPTAVSHNPLLEHPLLRPESQKNKLGGILDTRDRNRAPKVAGEPERHCPQPALPVARLRPRSHPVRATAVNRLLGANTHHATHVEVAMQEIGARKTSNAFCPPSIPRKTSLVREREDPSVARSSEQPQLSPSDPSAPSARKLQLHRKRLPWEELSWAVRLPSRQSDYVAKERDSPRRSTHQQPRVAERKRKRIGQALRLPRRPAAYSLFFDGTRFS